MSLLFYSTYQSKLGALAPEEGFFFKLFNKIDPDPAISIMIPLSENKCQLCLNVYFL